MKLVNFRRLKIGRRSRLRERKRSSNFINHQLIKIIYLNQDLNWQQICCFRQNWLRAALLRLSRVDRETIWPCGASERNLGDRETVPGHQGAAVVPADSAAKHEEIRPETHLLVRTEVSRLI